MKKAIILTLIGFGALAVQAQIPQPDPDTTARHFLIVASIGNLQEISMAQLALQKAKRADVQAFARMMIKDHEEAEQKLLALSKNKHIVLPASATGGIKPDIMLEKAGGHFDNAYIHAMASTH